MLTLKCTAGMAGLEEKHSKLYKVFNSGLVNLIAWEWTSQAFREQKTSNLLLMGHPHRPYMCW